MRHGITHLLYSYAHSSEAMSERSLCRMSGRLRRHRYFASIAFFHNRPQRDSGSIIIVGAMLAVIRYMPAQRSRTIAPLRPAARRPASRTSLSGPDSSTRRGGPPVHVGGGQRLRFDEDPLAFIATPRAAEAHDDRGELARLLGPPGQAGVA
jgi:hypothetical protein